MGKPKSEPVDRDKCEHTSECSFCKFYVVIAIFVTLVFAFVLYILWRRFCKHTRKASVIQRERTRISTIGPPPYEYPQSTSYQGNQLVHRGRRLGNLNPIYTPDQEEQGGTNENNVCFRSLYHPRHNSEDRQISELSPNAYRINEGLAERLESGRQGSACNDINRANEQCDEVQTPSFRSRVPGEHATGDLQETNDSNRISNENGCVPDDVSFEHNTSSMEVMSPRLFDNSLSRLMQETGRSVRTKIGDKLVVYITRRVGHRGDYLILDNMGISLHVPPLAVKEGRGQLVTLVLNWDLGDNPNMTDNEALVSPVVYVGPHGLKLDKPCRLTYKHCAFDPRQIQVMKSETEIVEQKDWKIMCEREDNSGACVLTPDECQLQINSFTLFTCVQTPLEGERSKKWLQLAVFSNPIEASVDHHQVRIYFLNKTPCALQWAIQSEEQFGGKLICPEKVFLFHGNEMDAFVSLRYLCEGWHKVDEDESERINYLSIWHGKCPHVSMCFKKSRLHVNELNLQMYVNQDTLENEGEKLIIHAMESGSHNGENKSFVCPRHREEIVVNQSDRQTVFDYSSDAGSSHRNLKIVFNKEEPEVNLAPASNMPDDCFLPYDVKTELKYLLDPRNQLGNDWRALAAQLGFDKCIRKLESFSNPTEILLKELENRHTPIKTIMEVLHSIGRRDAAVVIQSYLQKKNALNRGLSQNIPTEGTDISGYRPYSGVR